MSDAQETADTLRAYADAWLAGDLEQVLGSYHDEIVLHYMGESPLAGTHVGVGAEGVSGLLRVRHRWPA
ncbi:MAG: hypothetical protein ACKOFC_02690 [Solirubrobacterales bacterium]